MRARLLCICTNFRTRMDCYSFPSKAASSAAAMMLSRSSFLFSASEESSVNSFPLSLSEISSLTSSDCSSAALSENTSSRKGFSCFSFSEAASPTRNSFCFSGSEHSPPLLFHLRTVTFCRKDRVDELRFPPQFLQRQLGSHLLTFLL